ncbi:cofD-related protein, GAK system [Nitzschia inconspicua]|uniref:CofD-related protein, GAK system n=1 Tax=Nitzschia inconspicua TaxID=303405 RepID=A0A9K3L658_9STRA|nr:cofD-related protein, GAK system [Nitzschia inconspicua]
MQEERFEPLKGEDSGAKGKTQRKHRPPLSKDQKLQKFRSSSFSDSLDQSDNNDAGDCPYSTLSFVRVTRLVTIPDQVRVERSLRLPEFGPKILFFSGGTAIRDLSSCLKDYTHNSIHLITPFDSGGSSAEIRRAFDMLSVGDLRNRLLALAARDEATARNNPQIVEVFSHRLGMIDRDGATKEFFSILGGHHPLMRAVQMPMRRILQNHLKWFACRMPIDFDLREASIGNLIITGCFLEHDRDIVSVIFMISKFLGVRGFCRPLTAANLHIRTLYDDGTEEVGQHLMNQQHKDTPDDAIPLRKIVQIDLVDHLHSEERQQSQKCHIDIVSSDLVASADLIVFPMGSFFASILVNLLPKGVGRAIVRRQCPKVYIPNTGCDPEMTSYTLAECVQRIISMVQEDCYRHSDRQLETPPVPVSEILNFVVIDTSHCHYSVEIDKDVITNLGVVILDVPLVELEQGESCKVTGSKSPRLDPRKVSEVLISLAS